MADPLTSLILQLKERRAQTFQERLKSLDIRDEIWRKYIELNKGSAIDATNAQRTGLSNDMCCERERITREYQRLYKSYEIDPDTRALNHALMVTEYSRACADQAMPSPYDLRSGAALLNTMNYLTTNIMDKFDQEREQGDWYNFLWDRLRAVRKELTQQHLRDKIAVEVLEQCARFHIFCSAFLSEHSRDLFDPKLNQNMLIDCLHQLRECYMTHKRSNNVQALKNLAEFTSYMLLIDLKEDNETLLRIRQLIEDLTDRSEMNVAIEIQRALISNNTSKFFSLIEEKATLLQSCLVHRYFPLIRFKRLKCLIASARESDEIRLVDLLEILGMDDETEMKDYLEQWGYTVNSDVFILPKMANNDYQQMNIKLSQRLIKSKYRGNLKDIITGEINAPVVIPDNNIENSFDLQGAFIGRLPVDLDSYVPPTTRKQWTESQQPPMRPAAPIGQSRPPSSSALRSMAATTTANTFTIRTQTTSEPRNRFTPATTTTPTVLPSLFRSGGFSFPSSSTASSTVPNLFNPPVKPSNPRLTPSNAFEHRQERPPPPNFASKPVISQVDIVVQPPPPPVVRRLSMNSVEILAEEIFEQFVDPLLRETTCDIFDELISQWNEQIVRTLAIYDEFLHDEILSIVDEHFSQIAFEKKMFDDTLAELDERRRRKYLERKYFSIWQRNSSEARVERSILNEFQLKYHFFNNEQLLEFLTGLQLISEHSLTIDETKEILKCRRFLKRTRQQRLNELCNELFHELLNDEFRSLILESNDETRQREVFLQNALEKQRKRQREHFLHRKYFSLWFSRFRSRRNSRQLTKTKRFNPSRTLESNKRRKYQTMKDSFEQIQNDLQQMKSFVDQFCL